MCPSSNTRWCPTPEQLMILEELYRRGLKTPNATQIQRITAHLSLYGNIQGKNVFYWFQNHKARDRQKLRKKLAKQLHHHHHHHHQLFYPHQTPLHFSPHLPTLHAQGTTTNGLCDEEAPECLMMMQRRWRAADDVPMDRLVGHDDTATIMGVGPTMYPCCTGIRNKPLQTLQLFPLTPPTADVDQSSTS